MQNATRRPAIGTQTKFRFSLFQLVLLATGIAALLAWLLQDRTRELVWNHSILPFEAPVVPESYKRGQAEKLFVRSYTDGWNAYRYHFYRNYDLANDKFSLQKDLQDIDISVDGTSSAKALAYASGYNDARAQIQELLLTFAPDELRQKLARKKASSHPILLIAIGCLSFFAVARVRQPK